MDAKSKPIQVDVRSNPVGARTFDDFAVGMMLAEIGTGVPPFFNPDYDYFSEKEGNLQTLTWVSGKPPWVVSLFFP